MSTRTAQRPRVSVSSRVWHAATPAGPHGFAPLEVVRGQAEFLYDAAGNQYINGFSGLLLPCGLAHPEINAAIAEQLDRLGFCSLFRMTNPLARRLAQTLVEIAPGAMSRVLFTNSGSEAAEAAIKVARQHFKLRGHPHKTAIVALERSYHGPSLGAFSLSGMYPPGVRDLYGPLPADLTLVEAFCTDGCPAPASTDGCPAPAGDGICRGACATPLVEHFERLGRERVAAVMIEPVQAAGGVRQPGRAFLERVCQACREHEVLLVVDETATGFGRTGRMFGSELADLRPDIVLIAKALSGGYLPLGAMLATESVFAPFAGAELGSVEHCSSQAGHPAALAAALKTIEIIERDELVGRAAALGAQLSARLHELCSHQLVRDVRCIGLMAALDLADPHDPTRPSSAASSRAINETLLRRGLITHVKEDRLALFLPLTTRAATVDRVGEILQTTFDAVAAED